MQFTTVMSFVLVALGVVVGRVLDRQVLDPAYNEIDFSYTCPDFDLLPSPTTVYLGGVCNTADGSPSPGTTMDLNNCIGNQDGTLLQQYMGGAMASCVDCSLGLLADGSPSSQLTCTCTRDDQTTITAFIDLNNIIGNVDGIFWCNGIEGISG